MRTLYIDCSMGAAGDMLTAALLELLPDPDGFVAELNALGIPGVHVARSRMAKCGIQGTHITVRVHGVEESDHHAHHHHHHSSLHDISHIVSDLPVSAKVRDDVMAVYGRIAEAESQAHGVSVTQIHFHEVGTMDAVTDIVAVCMLMERLAPEQVIASAVHVGSGQVHCAHGILPVPAPATAHILRGVPIYGGTISGELCTPTGAALLRHLVSRFGEMPVLQTEAIGYGMGTKDFPAANCVRVLLGETQPHGDAVIELRCNLDDMTPEAIGFALQALREAGALEVYTVSAAMKKDRPGVLLCVLCRPEQRDALLRLIFRHTTTLGVRECRCERHILRRHIVEMDTPYGVVHKKIASGYGVQREKYEYEDLARIAREQNCALAELKL